MKPKKELTPFDILKGWVTTEDGNHIFIGKDGNASYTRKDISVAQKEEKKPKIEENKISSIKDILSENRVSIVSSIKWIYSIWKKEDIIDKMVDFLKYAEKHGDFEKLKSSKRVKTDLKNMINAMAEPEKRKAWKEDRKKKEENNIRMYGKAKPKLEDLMAYSQNKQEDEGNVWHPIYKRWVKNEGINPKMSKNPKFV